MVMEKDYVAICPECKGLVGWMHGTLEPKEIAKETGRWIRQGLSVERMTTEESKTAKWRHQEGCSKIPKPKKKRAAKVG